MFEIKIFMNINNILTTFSAAFDPNFQQQTGVLQNEEK
jgi:hypothetical protein